MDQRRQILVVVVVTGLFLVWMRVAPVLFPTVFPKRDAADPQAVAGAGNQEAPVEGDGKPAAGDGRVVAPEANNTEPAGNGEAEAPVQPVEAPPQLTQHERVVVQLGADPVADGTGPQYLQTLGITSAGASIAWQQLSDPRYLTLDRTQQVKLLGNDPDQSARTLQTSIPAIDAQLDKYGVSLRTVDWKFETDASTKIAEPNVYQQVRFSYLSPDGQWEVWKTFSLNPVAKGSSDESPEGYLVDCELRFINHGNQTSEITYEMQGPVGLPLEDLANARVFREAEAGTLETVGNNETITPVKLSASQVVSKIQDSIAAGEPKDRPRWTYPVRWAGIDVQYFTALLIPTDPQALDSTGDGNPNGYFREILPTILKTVDPVEQSDISLLLLSNPVKVAPQGAIGDANEAAASGDGVSHRFRLYLGPKKAALLEPLMADAVIDYSWFPLLPQSLIRGVSKGLHWLLRSFHEWLFLPYWLAIILLTVVVRGCMFPLSRKQVKNMQKLKDLQPKLLELEKKYPDDRERRDREKLQLMMKHGANPLSGCLPLLLQMPIFIGLYGALSSAIDLRLQRFLYINNLASPDAVAPLGFTVPWVGWTELNLLPIVVIVLFQVQNKLFTPPPTNDEQAMQQKMMSYMMIVMGFLFYRVPSGLCLYFIASSLWGICERKVLDRHKQKLATAAEAGGPIVTTAVTLDENTPPKEPGFIARMFALADEAKRTNTSASITSSKGKKGKSS